MLIEYGGIVQFNNSVFSANIVDFYITNCQDWTVRIFNSNFTGSFSNTTSTFTNLPYIFAENIYEIYLES